MVAKRPQASSKKEASKSMMMPLGGKGQRKALLTCEYNAIKCWKDASDLASFPSQLKQEKKFPKKEKKHTLQLKREQTSKKKEEQAKTLLQ